MTAKKVFFLIVLSVNLAACGGTYGGPGGVPPRSVTKTADEIRYQADLEASVALLYAETEEGTLVNLCTCTPFERDSRDPELYRFVTAAHCVSRDDVISEITRPVLTNWYVTFDKTGVKQFYPAKLVAVGYMTAGDDLAVLEARIEDSSPMVTPISTEAPYRLQEIINVAGPLGLGKMFFQGYVVRPIIDRPIISVKQQINWQGTIALDVNANPGSSGSAIIDWKTRKIVGILVGVINGGGTAHVIAMPAQRFNRFYDEVKTGRYRYLNRGPAIPDGTNAASVSTTLKTIRQQIITRFTGQIPFDNAKSGWSWEPGLSEAPP